MKNLHNIGLTDLEYAALWYQIDKTPVFGVSLRFSGSVLQCKPVSKTEWEKVKNNQINLLLQRWAEEGSPKYTGSIDRV